MTVPTLKQYVAELEEREHGIKPVINPFWAYVLYIIVLHYFVFSLWPLAYWKICITFKLLDHLTGREFLNIATKVSFSTGIVMFFIFFAAGYNTTKNGATQQHGEPFPIYRRIIKILNNSPGLTALIWLIFYAFLLVIRENSDTEYYEGPPLPDLTVNASEVFPDFQAYYRVFGPLVYSIYFPFHFGTIFYISGLYFFLLLCMISNRLPFFLVIEPLNKHVWRRFKSSLGRFKRG